MSTASRATVQFLKSNRDNPHVYHLVARFTREAKGALGAPIGINFVMERVRWETSVVTTGQSYRLNNNFAPFYSRLIMHLNRDLHGVFEIRQSVADEPGWSVDPDRRALWEEAQQDNGWLEEAASDLEDAT